MICLSRDQIPISLLPGRSIQRAVGADGLSKSLGLTVGFAHYSDETGRMSPHQHAEEVIYILSAKEGWIRAGSTPNALETRVNLRQDMLLHISDSEWHVFEFSPGGHVDILFCYGQVTNVRPEDSSPLPVS